MASESTAVSVSNLEQSWFWRSVGVLEAAPLESAMHKMVDEDASTLSPDHEHQP